MIINQERTNRIMKSCHIKFVVIFILTAIITCLGVTAYKYEEYTLKANLGKSFVEVLYHAPNLQELSNQQTEKLKQIAIDEIVGRVSIELNSNRLEYTYYNMEKATKEIKPVFTKVTDDYIEFLVSIDGEIDGRIRAIWFDVDNGKISEFKEAILVPFAKDEVEDVEK